jgi:hypothetical protein
LNIASEPTNEDLEETGKNTAKMLVALALSSYPEFPNGLRARPHAFRDQGAIAGCEFEARDWEYRDALIKSVGDPAVPL